MSDVTDMGQATVVVYGGDGSPSVFTPDTSTADASVPGLAQAVDASIDAIGDALNSGNMGQASALQTSAAIASDALLSALGADDDDDSDSGY